MRQDAAFISNGTKMSWFTGSDNGCVIFGHHQISENDFGLMLNPLSSNVFQFVVRTVRKKKISGPKKYAFYGGDLQAVGGTHLTFGTRNQPGPAAPGLTTGQGCLPDGIFGSLG